MKKQLLFVLALVGVGVLSANRDAFEIRTKKVIIGMQKVPVTARDCAYQCHGREADPVTYFETTDRNGWDQQEQACKCKRRSDGKIGTLKFKKIEVTNEVPVTEHDCAHECLNQNARPGANYARRDPRDGNIGGWDTNDNGWDKEKQVCVCRPKYHR